MHTSLTEWLAPASLSQRKGKREIVDDVFGRNCTYKSREKNTRGSGSLSLSACSFGPLASSIEFGKADQERERPPSSISL